MLLTRYSISLAALITSLAIPAAAQLGNKPLEVVNPSGETLSVDAPAGVNVNNFPSNQTVSGTVSVGNFPSNQSVSGTVSVNNFPSTQAVSGTINVGNLPTVQTVNGAVSVNGVVYTQELGGSHVIGISQSDLVRYNLVRTPAGFTPGITLYSKSSPTGAGESSALDPDECLVLLDISVMYRIVEVIGETSLGPAPFFGGHIFLGMSDGAEAFYRHTQLFAVANEQGYGEIHRHFDAGWKFEPHGADLNQLAMQTFIEPYGDHDYLVVVLGSSATGYLTAC